MPRNAARSNRSQFAIVEPLAVVPTVSESADERPIVLWAREHSSAKQALRRAVLAGSGEVDEVGSNGSA